MMAAAAAGRIIRRNAQRGLLLTLLLPAGFACSQSSSAAVDLRLDPATTSIRWTLGATAHTVHGSFQLKSGAIHVDPATRNASGLIVIDATTGQSGDKARDRRMHRDVLESAKYPEITFRPVRVLRQDSPLNLTAPGMFTLEGILTLHGQEHSLSLSVTLRPGPNGLSGQTQFDIPYVAWGLKDPSTFILRVEKRVHIDLTTLAVPTAAVAP